MSRAKLEPIIRHISKTVQNRSGVTVIQTQNAHLAFLSVPIMVTSNDLDRRNIRYFSLLHQIR